MSSASVSRASGMENEFGGSRAGAAFSSRRSSVQLRGTMATVANVKNRKARRESIDGNPSDISVNSSIMSRSNYYRQHRRNTTTGSGSIIGGGVGGSGSIGGGGNESISSKSTKSTGSTSGTSCNGISCSDDCDSSTTSGEPNLQYPGFPEVALRYLTQDARPRNWCLLLITNPYPFLNNS